MDIIQAIEARHSVRHYLDKPIDPAAVATLQEAIEERNRAAGLNMALVLDGKDAIGGVWVALGFFKGVRSYIALAGPDKPGLDELCGYHGEALVLLAQQLGLNTCWAAMVRKRKMPSDVDAAPGVRKVIGIALGYGENQGKERDTRILEDLCSVEGTSEMPDWFAKAMLTVQMAPTARNQQKFHFALDTTTQTVTATCPPGMLTNLDLGIAKYHFEVGAAAAGANLGETWNWA
jgi:hypothetical protein